MKRVEATFRQVVAFFLLKNGKGCIIMVKIKRSKLYGDFV